MLLEQDTFRQYFRIVTSNVSFWYKDHSTPNPLGVVPDPSITKTVVGDKFSEGVEIFLEDIRIGKIQMNNEKHLLNRRREGRCDYHKYYPGSCDKCSS